MITVNAIQHLEVEVIPAEERRIAVQFLCRLFGLTDDAHVYQDRICTWVAQGGHNNDIEREPVPGKKGVPCHLDMAAITVLQHIRQASRV